MELHERLDHIEQTVDSRMNNLQGLLEQLVASHEGTVTDMNLKIEKLEQIIQDQHVKYSINEKGQVMQRDEYITTLGFHAQFMPYYGDGGSIYPAHHGLDLVPKNAPAAGFEIKVNGVPIGIMGETGAADGVHLHVDKSIAYPTSLFTNYKDPSDWQSIEGEVVFVGAAGSAGNIVVIKATNGHFYRFLHLESTLAKVGQLIKQGAKTMTREEFIVAYDGFFHKLPSEQEIVANKNASTSQILTSLRNNARHLELRKQVAEYPELKKNSCTTKERQFLNLRKEI